jgi:hypothetical protein
MSELYLLCLRLQAISKEYLWFPCDMVVFTFGPKLVMQVQYLFCFYKTEKLSF